MIREQDLRIDLHRASGFLGDVNGVTVRITHMRSGAVGVGNAGSAMQARDEALRELLPKLRAAGYGLDFEPQELCNNNLGQAIQGVVRELDQAEEE